MNEKTKTNEDSKELINVLRIVNDDEDKSSRVLITKHLPEICQQDDISISIINLEVYF